MDRSSYGGPPQSTIGNSARRIQAQLPAEPPACVQNAMMRRDKQPFTYTPGGIDLSQIKSPRMAKRISRNANSEGVTGQPKVSPLAQNNGSNHNGNGTSNGSQSSVSPAATLGAAAMGMPFQVFPTGPPAPPPPPPPTGRVVPSNGGNRSVPPPPPPPGPGPALPMASSSDARKSPRPQSFEPPPMGMRPEIKIPPNPMAGLRKAPRPQPKNDFWIEEYRREKQQDEPQIPRPVPPSYSYTNRDLDDEAPAPVSARPVPSVPSQQLTQNNIRPAAADVSVPAQQHSTPASVQQQYAQQVQQAPRSVGPPVAAVSQTTVTMPVNRGYPQQAPVYAQAQPAYSTQSPAGTPKERIIPIQIEKSPVQAPVSAPNFAPPPYYSPNAQYGPAGPNSSMQSPIPVGFATPHSGFTTPTAMFTNPNHFVNQGYNNISYPPTPTGQPHPLYQHHQHYPPPQPPQAVLHHQMHSQPQQQQQQQQQQRMQQHTPTQQQPNVTNVRIVPMKVEGADHTVRGPLSNTPAIIQSDPRSSSNTQSWNGNSAPNQSRSFRVLQHITDTLDEAEAEMNAKDQSNSQATVADQTDATKQQSFGRSAGAAQQQQQDMAEGQLRRLQLSNEDKALMNRVKNQGSGNRTQQMFNRGNYNDSDGDTQQQSQQYVPPSEQKVEEPKKYTGGSIPSRSFKMLQAMTDAPGPGETDF